MHVPDLGSSGGGISMGLARIIYIHICGALTAFSAGKSPNIR